MEILTNLLGMGRFGMTILNGYSGSNRYSLMKTGHSVLVVVEEKNGDKATHFV